MARIIIAVVGLLITVYLLSTFLGNWFTTYGEELPCLIYNDGKIAVISNDYSYHRNGSGFWASDDRCEFPKNIETIKWFLSNGYNIVDVSESFSPLGDRIEGKVWMSR